MLSHQPEEEAMCFLLFFCDVFYFFNCPRKDRNPGGGDSIWKREK